MVVNPAPVPDQFKTVVDVAEKKPDDEDTAQETVGPDQQSKEPGDIIRSPSDYGLQELASVDQLHITKKVAMSQLISLRSRRNRYQIRTANKRMMFYVIEENSWWMGFLCYGLRPCQLKVMNDTGDVVIRINRPFAFTTRVTPCQLQRMEVYSPPEKLIGTIEQQWSPLKPLYSIKGQDGEDLFVLRGPANTVSMYRDLHFEITRPDGERVGSTTKRWRGLVHALFRSPVLDKFTLAFQRDLSVEEKALLLASTLLVDYMYYDT